MIYAILVASGFLLVSAMTAVRPGRSGIFRVVAFPVGWAASELAVQAVVIQCGLVFLQWWWGWPNTLWFTIALIAVGSFVIVLNVVLVIAMFQSRTTVRRAMLNDDRSPLDIGAAGDDQFGSWWRTLSQVPLHPRSMQLVSNVPYGPHARHRLDIWRQSTTPSDAPIIFFVHGGSWIFGDKREQGRPMLHEFVARGWIAVTVNYRLAPKYPWPAQIEDVTRAFGWVKSSIRPMGGDPTRIVVAGASAGGQLASLLSLASHDDTWRPRDTNSNDDWSVRGCISLYGVLEMTGDDDVWNGKGRGLRHLLERYVVVKNVDKHRELFESISPLARITNDAPAFLVIHGSNDTLVDRSVARHFVDRFRLIAREPVYYVELPLTQHAFDVIASPRTSSTTRAAVAFAAHAARLTSPPESVRG